MCFAFPGQIEEVWFEGPAKFATANFAGERRKISLVFLPDLTIGDYVIVHAGHALSKVAPEQVAEVMDAMEQAADALATADDADLAAEAEAIRNPGAVDQQNASGAESRAAQGAVAATSEPDSKQPEPQLDIPVFGTPLMESSIHSDDVCITCSDQAVPVEIVRLPAGPFEPALVRTSEGTEEEVDVSLVGDVAVGDRVLVHARTAIERLDRVDA
jgi:hydrogenase expression/formation protein HypC